MLFKKMKRRIGEWVNRRITNNIKLIRVSVSPHLRFPVSLSHLLLVSFLLLTLCPSPSSAIKDRVVAFVDNIAITLSELDEIYTESLKHTPDITKEEALNTMLNRLLLLREAKKLRLEAASEEKLLQEYIDLKIRPHIRIKEEEVSDFYQKHINDFQGKEFEAVREEIEHYLAERELNQLLKNYINELRNKANIKNYPNHEAATL